MILTGVALATTVAFNLVARGHATRPATIRRLTAVYPEHGGADPVCELEPGDVVQVRTTDAGDVLFARLGYCEGWIQRADTSWAR